MKDIKSTKQTKPVGTAKSKNELTAREPPVVHPQGAERPRRARPVRIDDDRTQRDRKRGRRNDTLWIPEAKERTQPKNPDAVAKSKYQPTDYERTVLAKQAERLKDQVRVPRMKFVMARSRRHWPKLRRNSSIRKNHWLGPSALTGEVELSDPSATRRSRAGSISCARP